MGTVRTVTGDIDSGTLGHCQCHEHIFLAKGKSYEVNPALWMDDEAASRRELNLYKEAGGGTIVDAQPVGGGSMPRQLYDASVTTGIRIVASTGFHKLIFYPEDHWLFTAEADEIAEYFTYDITIGMAGDADNDRPFYRYGTRAGIIKCALDMQGLEGVYTKLFRAAVNAHMATNAPIMVHTEDGAHAGELVDFMTGLGVLPEKLILCHMERSVTRMDEKIRAAKTGVYLQCDTIARYKYHNDEDEALFLKRMCDEGLEERLLLGLDTTRQRLKSYGGETGLDYILTDFLPLLKKQGFSDEQLHRFCAENPAQALCIT